MTACYADHAGRRLLTRFSGPRLVLFGIFLLTIGASDSRPGSRRAPPAAPVESAAAKPADGNQGQADLDEAVIQRIDANTSAAGGRQCPAESALPGTTKKTNRSPKKCLGVCSCNAARAWPPRWSKHAAEATVAIERRNAAQSRRAVSNDPTLVEAHLLIARLNLLPGGDREAVKQATTQAIELLADDPAEQSSALVLRALTQEDDLAESSPI